MKTFVLRSYYLLGFALLFLPSLFAQSPAKVYDDYQTLVGPDGVKYTYNMKGDPQAANPSTPVNPAIIKANPDFCRRVSPNRISYALLHQLTVDRALRDSAQ